MAIPTVSGNTAGLNPSFLNSVLAAASSLGATQLIINSGYRSPQHNAAVGGVSRSNHLTGQAIDGYLVINGQQVPLGTALLPIAGQYGLRSGDVPGFYHGARDPVHVDNAANLGGVKTLPWKGGATAATFIPNAPAGGVGSASPLNTWHPNAQLAYTLGVQAGLTPAQATDFAAVQWGESGFDPNARNKKSGAAGLYQLLSSGYVNKANQLGGVFNPRANILAILPDYVNYYKAHPTLVPGAAGAAVERSGEGPAYYAAGYAHLGSGVPTGGGGVPTVTGAGVGGASLPAVVGSLSPGVAVGVPTGQTVTPFSLGSSVVGSKGDVTVAAPKPTIVHPANRPAYFQSSYGPKAGTKPPVASGGGGGGKGSGRAAAPFDWNGLIKLVNTPVDLSGLLKVADTRAASETARLITGIQAEQQAARDAASLRATQQTQAALAASKYMQGLDIGGQVAGDYAQAAAAQRAAAAGYSGGLQQTVDEAAARVQANLQAAGSPQTAVNQGAAAGNVLYGLGGNLPSQQLDVVGPAVAAEYRAVPQQLLGYGQSLAAGQLSLGEQEAAKLTPDIIAAKANQATLAAKYYDTLSSAALEAGQDRIANLFKVLGLKQKQDAADATAAWRNAQLNKPVVIHSGNDVFMFDPRTGKTTQTIQGAQKPPTPFGSGSSGYFTIDPATGKVIQLTTGTGSAPKIFGSAAFGYFAIDPKTGKPVQLVTGTGGTPKIFGSGESGYFAIGPDGKPVQIVTGTGPAPSTAAGTAPPYFHAANSNAQGIRSDQYGDPIPDANGNQTLMPGWHWKGGVVNGTPVKNKTGAAAKPYNVPDGIYNKAYTIAQTAFGVQTANPITGALIGSGVRKSYAKAYKMVAAYLRGAQVPTKFIFPTATQILESVGYTAPPSITAEANSPGKFPGFGSITGAPGFNLAP